MSLLRKSQRAEDEEILYQTLALLRRGVVPHLARVLHHPEGSAGQLRRYQRTEDPEPQVEDHQRNHDDHRVQPQCSNLQPRQYDGVVYYLNQDEEER